VFVPVPTTPEYSNQSPNTKWVLLRGVDSGMVVIAQCGVAVHSWEGNNQTTGKESGNQLCDITIKHHPHPGDRTQGIPPVLPRRRDQNLGIPTLTPLSYARDGRWEAPAGLEVAKTVILYKMTPSSSRLTPWSRRCGVDSPQKGVIPGVFPHIVAATDSKPPVGYPWDFPLVFPG